MLIRTKPASDFSCFYALEEVFLVVLIISTTSRPAFLLSSLVCNGPVRFAVRRLRSQLEILGLFFLPLLFLLSACSGPILKPP